MSNETFYAAIIGAGPTLLIAYFLEYRAFLTIIPFESKGRWLGWFVRTGMASTFFSSVGATVALAFNLSDDIKPSIVASFLAGLACIFVFSLGLSLHYIPRSRPRGNLPSESRHSH